MRRAWKFEHNDIRSLPRGAISPVETRAVCFVLAIVLTRRQTIGVEIGRRKTRRREDDPYDPYISLTCQRGGLRRLDILRLVC